MCHLTASPRRSVSLDAPQCPSQTSIILGTKRPRGMMSNSDRSVQFSETTDTIGQSDTRQEDIPTMWYGQKELEMFKKQARDHVLGRSTNTDKETRGYERYNVAIAKKKALTRKVTLLACSQKALSPEDVALIVQRSTRWAVNDAFRAGCRDFCQVYHPEMIEACSMIGKRSCHHDTHQSERNVRRRTAPCQPAS
jgi:hypothetical protein